MNGEIVLQDEQKVKLLDLVNRADKMLAVLLADEDEDSPMGRAMARWLLDAEAATQSDKCAYPPCQNAAQPGRPLCADCEEWESAAWRDHADELRQYAAVSAGVG